MFNSLLRCAVYWGLCIVLFLGPNIPRIEYFCTEIFRILAALYAALYYAGVHVVFSSQLTEACPWMKNYMLHDKAPVMQIRSSRLAYHMFIS